MQVGMYGENMTSNFTCETQYVKIPHGVYNRSHVNKRVVLCIIILRK